MKKSKILLTAALAAALVAVLAVGSTLAYFTAHTEATGIATVALGYETELHDKVDGMNKHVSITNKGPESVWVRVKAYSVYDLSYTPEEGSENWIAKGEYYEYKVPLGVGDTDELIISITAPAEESGTEEFNVVVIYEYTKVLYKDDGTAYADWDLAVQIVE